MDTPPPLVCACCGTAWEYPDDVTVCDYCGEQCESVRDDDDICENCAEGME